MKQIEVVGAVIVRDGLVFCAQRSTGPLAGKWEFPGGKLEPGESASAALEREIREELGCGVSVGDRVTVTSHEYEFGIVNLSTYFCEITDGEPELTEHIAALWLAASDLDSIEWAPADMPAVNLLKDKLRA